MSRRNSASPSGKPARGSASASAPPNFVSLVSLGCPKNQVDSENLLGELLQRDVVLCPDPADASVIIVNTCGFIAPAREEGASVLRECLELRRKGPCRRLIVAGCWVEREENELRKRFPEVDVWAGLLTPERIAWLVERVRVPAEDSAPPERSEKLRDESARVRLTPGHWAYLRIADGCDNRCAYCTIPDIRGCLRSKPEDDVLTEACALASEGVKELCLIAQDITAYGHDVDGCSHLAGLLRDLAGFDGFEWIRLLYTHPAHFGDDVIEAMAAEPKICRYVDLPIQHINDRILRLMGRGVGRAEVEALVAKLRARMPGIVIRTTVIVGFPGETETEFAELCDFLRQARFERLGAFAYSPETGTPAARLGGQLSDAERRRRVDEVMRIQQGIAFEAAESWVGRETPVILDRGGDRPGTFVGRTPGDAPEIDPVIHLAGKGRTGQIRRARVTKRLGYDLTGSLLSP